MLNSRFEALAVASTLAVSVIANEDVSDVELLELRPTLVPMDEALARTAGRAMSCHLGVMGIVDGLPQAAFSRELDPVRLRALAHAFHIYCEARFEELIVATASTHQEVNWLERLHQS
jgi:hypothetical protein